jgi:hypothetical protein
MNDKKPAGGNRITQKAIGAAGESSSAVLSLHWE